MGFRYARSHIVNLLNITKAEQRVNNLNTQLILTVNFERDFWENLKSTNSIQIRTKKVVRTKLYSLTIQKCLVSCTSVHVPSPVESSAFRDLKTKKIFPVASITVKQNKHMFCLLCAVTVLIIKTLPTRFYFF